MGLTTSIIFPRAAGEFYQQKSTTWLQDCGFGICGGGCVGLSGVASPAQPLWRKPEMTPSTTTRESAASSERTTSWFSDERLTRFCDCVLGSLDASISLNLVRFGFNDRGEYYVHKKNQKKGVEKFHVVLGFGAFSFLFFLARSPKQLFFVGLPLSEPLEASVDG
ncbi:hypothetical protein LZ30DRAFT_268136 [Colletotrichum cereale]|nr:hypothetical protein LZ30DRAFT_268136 [Colletotrichum cereale]